MPVIQNFNLKCETTTESQAIMSSHVIMKHMWSSRNKFWVMPLANMRSFDDPTASMIGSVLSCSQFGNWTQATQQAYLIRSSLLDVKWDVRCNPFLLKGLVWEGVALKHCIDFCNAALRLSFYSVWGGGIQWERQIESKACGSYILTTACGHWSSTYTIFMIVFMLSLIFFHK